MDRESLNVELLAEESRIDTHHTHVDKWDLVIEPNTGWFAINLREIWRYRDLLFLFVKRDLTAQYKQTILGPTWHFIQPVFTTAIFLLLFKGLASFPTDGIPPVLFYMSGITIWNYFGACLMATSNSFVANASIFGKVYFPRLIMPLSTVLSNMAKFGIRFSLLLAVMVFYALKGGGLHVSFSWLLLPVLVLMMAGLGLGLGIIVSSLTTKYRDLNVLIGFVVQLLMYATPVVYPLSFLKSKPFASWIAWNPLTPIVEAFRHALFGTTGFQISSLAYCLLFTLLVLFAGIALFSKVEKVFIDTV